MRIPTNNKYGAHKTVIDGMVFDSKAEANRWCELKIMERCGAISDLERQRKFPLINKSRYGGGVCFIADFVDRENGGTGGGDGKSKTTATPPDKLKKRLMAEIHGIEIREVGI